MFISVHGSTESAKVTKLTTKNMRISGIFLVRKRQKSDRLQKFLGDPLIFLSVFCNSLTRKRREACLLFAVITLNAKRMTNYFFLNRNIIRSNENIHYLSCVFISGIISFMRKKSKKHLIGSATYSKFAGCKTAILLKIALLYWYFYALGMRLTV